MNTLHLDCRTKLVLRTRLVRLSKCNSLGPSPVSQTSSGFIINHIIPCDTWKGLPPLMLHICATCTTVPCSFQVQLPLVSTFGGFLQAPLLLLGVSLRILSAPHTCPLSAFYTEKITKLVSIAQVILPNKFSQIFDENNTCKICIAKQYFSQKTCYPRGTYFCEVPKFVTLLDLLQCFNFK